MSEFVVMQPFVYHARFEPGDERGIVVTFPDVPEAITEGDNEVEARDMAEKALALALLSYPMRGKPLPAPASQGGGLVPIIVAPEDAAKLAVLDAWRHAGVSKSVLARRLGKDEKEVRRILDPMHSTKLSVLEAALRALGRRLVISTEAVAAA
jgi:antitoxin HicB